jgi:hypothetical protein
MRDAFQTVQESAREKLLDPREPPAQTRVAETVKVVLETAARILEQHGFEGYSTNVIVRLPIPRQRAAKSATTS